MTPTGGYDHPTSSMTSADEGTTVDPWPIWTATAVTRTARIWHYWVQEPTSADNQGFKRTTTFPSQPKLNPRGVRRRRLDDARNRGLRRQAENEKAKEKIRAERRARKLLLELIGKTDYKKFLELGYIDVAGGNGNTYRIRPRGEIQIIREEIAVESLCITTPNYYLGEIDNIIWKKLLAEANEDLLLEVANHSRIEPGIDS